MDAFPGCYRTGDGGHVDADGDVWVLGRTDDVINVAGHRFSTGAIEEVLAVHPDVAECAVIGTADALKGGLPLGLVVLKASAADRDRDDVTRELIELVRARVGAVASCLTYECTCRSGADQLARNSSTCGTNVSWC